MKKIISLIFIVVAIAIVSITIHNQPITLSYALDVLAVDNLDDAVENANYIVKGHFSNYIKEWNMLDDPNEQMLAKVYQFNIDSCYKGNITNNIPVSMHYSTRLFYNNDGLIHGAEIKKTSQFVDVIENNYIQPDNNKEYILFLTYNQSAGVYQPAFYPYCIEVNGDKLEVQTNNNTSLYAALVDENKNVKVIQKTCGSTNIVKNISRENFESRFY